MTIKPGPASYHSRGLHPYHSLDGMVWRTKTSFQSGILGSPPGFVLKVKASKDAYSQLAIFGALVISVDYGRQQ